MVDLINHSMVSVAAWLTGNTPVAAAAEAEC